MTSIFWILLSVAQAGFLKMVGQPQLDIRSQQGQLQLQGNYRIVNEGNSPAFQVYPQLKIDGFQWAGEPEDIEAGESVEWKINEVLKPLTLPPSGEFLVRVQKFYRDQNAYSFQVPDLFILKTVAEDQPSSLSVKMKIRTSRENGTEFQIEYEIQNAGAESLRAQLNVLLPAEVTLLSPVVPVDVPGRGNIRGTLQFKNEKALSGSNYVAFLTAEWSEAGLRRTSFAYDTFQIKEAKQANKWSRDQLFWAWWVWGLFVGLLAMWWFWLRPLQNHLN